MRQLIDWTWFVPFILLFPVKQSHGTCGDKFGALQALSAGKFSFVQAIHTAQITHHHRRLGAFRATKLHPEVLDHKYLS